MSMGLTIWDSSGGVVVTISDRISKFFGQYSFNTGGSYYVDISAPGINPLEYFAYSNETNVQVLDGLLRVFKTPIGSATNGTALVFSL